MTYTVETLIKELKNYPKDTPIYIVYDEVMPNANIIVDYNKDKCQILFW